MSILVAMTKQNTCAFLRAAMFTTRLLSVLGVATLLCDCQVQAVGVLKHTMLRGGAGGNAIMIIKRARFLQNQQNGDSGVNITADVAIENTVDAAPQTLGIALLVAAIVVMCACGIVG